MATATPTPPEKKVNWETAKVCLAGIQREAPAILHQAVLIGGIACWFYRNLLSKANDPDFKVPQFSEQQEALWLSKDVDFTNFFSEDARQLLHRHVVSNADGRRALQIEGIPIGFAQVGLTFDPETAWAESWIAAFDRDGTTIECRILDPVSLYREKLSLVDRRGSDSDRLHLMLMAEFLKFETCKEANALAAAKSLEERTAPAKFLMGVRDRAIEVCRDRRLANRVHSLLAQAQHLSPLERKLLGEISNVS